MHPTPACPALTVVQVYGELIAQIEAPVEAVCDLDVCLEGLLSTLDDIGAPGVLAAIDYKAAMPESSSSSSGSAAAASNS